MVIRHQVKRLTTNETLNSITVHNPFHGEITISYELVTPEIAQYWLDNHNERNRRVNERHKGTLARQMIDGDWLLTTDGIGFDQNEQLCNGQHRLSAVVESGTSQHFIIVRHLDPDTFDYIDLTRKRQAADLLDRIGGYLNTSSLGATLKLLLLYRTKGHFDDRRAEFTNAEIVRHLEHEPEVEYAVHRAAQLRRAGLRSVPPALVSALYQVFRECSADDVDPFMDKLATGIGFTDNSDPVYALLRRLSDPATKNKNDKAALTIHAWNHYRRNMPLQKMYVPKSFPKPI